MLHTIILKWVRVNCLCYPQLAVRSTITLESPHQHIWPARERYLDRIWFLHCTARLHEMMTDPFRHNHEMHIYLQESTSWN